MGKNTPQRASVEVLRTFDKIFRDWLEDQRRAEGNLAALRTMDQQFEIWRRQQESKDVVASKGLACNCDFAAKLQPKDYNTDKPVAVPVAGKPKPQSDLSKALDRLENLVGVLEIKIECLEARLSPILGAAKENHVTEAQPCSMVPLVKTLDVFGDRMDTVGYRIQTLLDRLEV